MTYYPLKLSQGGIDLIKGFEFFVPHYYLHKGDKPTIGYGSTQYKDGTAPKPGDTITEPDALALMIYWATTKANAVAYAIRNPLNQNQQDSIISLVYNIGVGDQHGRGFLSSHVLKIINVNPKDPGLKQWWLDWDKEEIDGKLVVLPGLTKRRQEEVNLFFKAI